MLIGDIKLGEARAKNGKRPATFPHDAQITSALFNYVKSRNGILKLRDLDRSNERISVVMVRDLADHFNVSMSDRLIAHSGNKTLWCNHIYWCRLVLVHLELFLNKKESGKGIWEITPGVTSEQADRYISSLFRKIKGGISIGKVERATKEVKAESEEVETLEIAFPDLISISTNAGGIVVRWKK